MKTNGRYQKQRNTFLILIVNTLLLCSTARAVSQVGNRGNFGLGGIFGDPTGLTGKYWLSEHTAIDGGLAWHFGNEDRLQLYADHLWHIDFASMHVPYGRLPVYVGLGLRVITADDPEAGIRIPFGLAYLLDKAPVEVFAELAPVINFAPSTDGRLDGGVGVRYYFK